ncbi:MAG: hypothetical protein V8T51_02025 [Senegalimassilia faecalis]
MGVVAGVLIVACCGGWAWHNTPSFCGTVCHDSMGNHLANYEGTDESNGAGLAAWHGQHEGTTCLDCHTAELDVQVAELQSQLAGDTDNLGLGDRYYIDNEKCPSCHGGSYDELAKQTESLGAYNPHNSPHGQSTATSATRATRLRLTPAVSAIPTAARPCAETTERALTV